MECANLLLTFLFPFGADEKRIGRRKEAFGLFYPKESGGLFEEERAIK
jgi:hypothetical protein